MAMPYMKIDGTLVAGRLTPQQQDRAEGLAFAARWKERRPEIEAAYRAYVRAHSLPGWLAP